MKFREKLSIEPHWSKSFLMILVFHNSSNRVVAIQIYFECMQTETTRPFILQSWVSDVNNSETITFYKHFRRTPNYSRVLEKIEIIKYKYC